MPKRAAASWIFLLLALTGCTAKSVPLSEGQRPPNIPGEMADARPSKPTTTPEERAKLVDDRLKQAEAAIARKDHATALEKLQEAIMTEPKDRKVLLETAKANLVKSRALFSSDLAESYRAGLTASNYLDSLQQYYPVRTDEEQDLAVDLYFNAATLQAMSLRVDETIGALNEAIGSGFKDLDRIRNDPEWKKMLEMPQFQKAFPDIVKGKPDTPKEKPVDAKKK